ncbi:MAG: hypothetical protein E6G69_04540 [Alphaproteobacteria bacterium]|nr:MAG: hypothetical protein E6G69_04540 [Alphaproteobacteria bacterium]
MLIWSTAAPAIGAAFLASVVEVVEAFTIVLAAATLRGWRPAALGTGAALAVLASAVLLLGPLLNQVPLHALQFAIGVLLLLMGMSWLRKACLRSAGVIPLHDEDAIFAAETAQLDVIAVGAGGGLLLPASIGALLACALVLVVGMFVHRPLSRVPENTLKFGVGVMLSAFGVFWTGEGLGLDWPGQDLALLLFVAIFLGAGLTGTAIARSAAMEVAR